MKHPGDELSLWRWEELLRSPDEQGGHWRSDLVGGGFDGEKAGSRRSFVISIAGGGGRGRQVCRLSCYLLLVFCLWCGCVRSDVCTK